MSGARSGYLFEACLLLVFVAFLWVVSMSPVLRSPKVVRDTQLIRLPPGVTATSNISIDSNDGLAIVIEMKEYNGPSLVNIPIRDQHGNFLGSLQLEASR